jgi:isocitrate dehydrogenase
MSQEHDRVSVPGAGALVFEALEDTISSGLVTYDLHRHIEDGEKLSTSEFAAEVVDAIDRLA